MKLDVVEYLQHGYAIVKKEKSSELTLVRMIIDKNGNVYKYDEILESKFKSKLIVEYGKQLTTNKKLINIEESIKNLDIKQLESLLPSYYQPAIEARIEELKEKENAITKTNRGAKKTTKVRDRK